jgi:hypothetical protein
MHHAAQASHLRHRASIHQYGQYCHLIDMSVFKDTLGLKWNLVSFFVSPYYRVIVGGLDVFGSTG